jgi:hypothetical protein
MKTTRQRTKNAASLTAAAFLLLAFCLWRPAELRAQQWTTATNGTDINNTNTGNVGVGTTTPSNAKLQIDFNDGVASGEHSVLYGSRSGTGTAGLKFGYRADGTNTTGGFIRSLANLPFFIGTTGVPQALTLTDSGSLGIGTTSPTRLLELSASSTNTLVYNASTAALSIFNTNTTANNTADLAFRTFDLGGTTISPAKVVAVFTNRSVGAASGDLAFVTLNASASAERMRVTGTGNVGIGTAAPGTRLHVNGTTLSGITAGTSGDYGARSLMLTTRPLNDGVASLGFDANSTYRGSFDFNGGSGLLTWYTNGGSGWSPGFVISAGGTVGIGMATPGAAYKLDVLGSVNSTGLCLNGDCRSTWSQVGSQWTPGTGSVISYSAGNVGIGLANPAYPLAVKSAGTLAPLNLQAGSGVIEIWKDSTPTKAVAFGSALPGTAAGEDAQISTYNGSAWVSRLTVQGSSGNVGIGTASPGARLDVVQANASAVRALSGSASAHVNIQIGRTAAEGTLGVAAGVGHYVTEAAAGDVILRTEDPTKRLLITNGPGATVLSVSGGKVGVGTATPGAGLTDTTVKLDVQGSISVSGNINAKYQDVAEWVPATQRLAAGTVVVLDTNRTNHVVASTKAYDTGVAGVISDSPGVILGEGGEDKLKVATTGRVKVKVDATRGPVHVGDLLVTSDVEGVAMKSVEVDLGSVKIHRPGTIIGKALEPLESGTGEILVLLSLQ